jgi:signal transduction histidine kinase
VDVTHTIHDLLQRLGGSLPVERVRVEGRAPRACADPAALERVLVNLVTNALKYSPESEPVAIRVESHDDTVAVRVSDRGPGLNPEEQRRIFDRFYRHARDARSEGLGLGLYITRMLVEQMGGSIHVESAPGRGSAFTVTLPAADRIFEGDAPPLHS